MADLLTKAKRKKPKKRTTTTVCTTKKTHVNGKVVRKKVCHKKKISKKKVVVRKKGPSAAAPPVTTPAAPLPQPPLVPPAAPDPMVYRGAFGVRQAERLLWRAGYGPRPGDTAALSALGLEGAVRSLTNVSGPAGLVGPEPSVNGLPLEPGDQYAHDHLAWLDRMVRSNQQLIERMALVFQDWFGIRSDDVGSYELTAAHVQLYRQHALGSFRDLLMDVTKDPAMLLFLSGANSDPNHPERELRPRGHGALLARRRPRRVHGVRTSARPPGHSPAGAPTTSDPRIGWTNFL